ncbi:HNH endonuclease [Methylobacterium sp. BE186]|uniref:HNH endonuclease n=1 Tax=Methylobacterium sp. BE186 TaxID=2817715 RepID=UPI00386218EB
MLGRPLRSGEEVHHINRDRSDNRQENLKVYADHLTHWMEEHYTDVARARGVANSNKSSKGSGPA